MIFPFRENSHPTKDRTLRTVYNEYAEVIVGSSIFKEFEGGLGVEISNLDFGILSQLRNVSGLQNVFNFAQNNNLNLIGPWNDIDEVQADPGHDVCRWWDDDDCRFPKPDDNRRRTQFEIGVFNAWLWARHKAWCENKTYRRSWRIWWLDRQPNSNRLFGTLWTDGENELCETTQAVDRIESCKNCSILENELNWWPSDVSFRVSNLEGAFLFSRHSSWSSPNDILRRLCLPENHCNPSDCND